MRLLHCQLQNVRVHGDLRLTFAPGLTLIAGPNEAGKSTLVEALHRTLFLKASATGPAVEALRSSRHLGIPLVQLGFEARGERWLLRKRFSGANGQVSLAAESAGRTVQGPVAEEELARLVGVAEMLGGRQANSLLPSRWAHLWVFQGSAGDNPLLAGKASYDADTLLDQLERSGGAAVQQSPRDQLVQQRLQEALAENYTSRGLRKHAPLWQREAELRAAGQALDVALERLQAYEQAAERLAALETRLEQLQGRDLPALLDRQRQLREDAEALSRLDQRIHLAQKELEPIRMRHSAVQELLREGDALNGQIHAGQQRLLDLEGAEQQAQQRERQLLAALEEQRRGRDQLAAQRQLLEPRQQLLADLLEQARLAEDRQRLSAALQHQRQLLATRQDLERQLAALPPLDRAGMQRLRQLQQQWRDTRTRQEALAAEVTLLRADQPVRLNGQALAPGEPRLLSALFELGVGDGVAVRIRPGGGQALGDLDQQCQRQEAALAQALAPLGVASLEQAEGLRERRSQLEQRLASLGGAVPPTAGPGAGSARGSSAGPGNGPRTGSTAAPATGPGAALATGPGAALATGPAAIAELEAQLELLEPRGAELERRLGQQAVCRQTLEAERQQPLPQDAAALQPLQRQLGETLAQLGRLLRQQEMELQRAQASLEQFRQGRRQAETELPACRAELAERQQRLADLLRQHSSRQALADLVAQRAQERQTAEQDFSELQRQRAALGSDDPAQALRQVQTAMEAAREQLEQLLDQRGAAKQQCDSISAADPHAAVEQARAQLEVAEAAHRGLQRVCDAQGELLRLFEAAVADLSSSYSEPLAGSIQRYLAPLALGPTEVKLRYDQSTGFHGLELRRGSDFFGHDQLSGGMREQLAAALRLAMADVLRPAHDGCLPLVFDDAFANADPERIEGVKRMLAVAVERGLQVILLTCDPASYAGFADHSLELPSSVEPS
jgi:DNA repair exonuclease SbcCD ATPase subunit